MTPVSRIYLVSTPNIIVPPRVTFMQARLFGGGGAGGYGVVGATVTANRLGSGGGAGGASLERFAEFGVTPGMSLDVVVGAGGVPGLVVQDGGGAHLGGDSYVQITAGADKARSSGARGGTVSGTYSIMSSTMSLTWGGGPTAEIHPFVILYGNYWDFSAAYPYTQPFPYASFGPGWGGMGMSWNNSWQTLDGTGLPGAMSLNGFAGGAGGVRGTVAPNNSAGGGGGGGAGGPGGVGGAGGHGGFGVFGGAGVGEAGEAGFAAAANTGGGGGGGGAGGGGSTTGGASGLGGAGGSGLVVLSWWQ